MRRFVFGLALLASVSMEAQQMNASVVTPTVGTLVTCESMNNVRQTCKVDARKRMVAVNQQLSENACVNGRTWGVDRDRKSIWVDGGCRAEFIVGKTNVAPSAFANTMICQSKNNGRANCAADTSYGVAVARQMSKNNCERGKDWGVNENGIWVDHGCRAEFTFGGTYDPAMSSRTTITCESTGVRNHCPALGTYNGVALATQMSRSSCVRGQTWGYDLDGVWVSGGCRAQFVVGR